MRSRAADRGPRPASTNAGEDDRVDGQRASATAFRACARAVSTAAESHDTPAATNNGASTPARDRHAIRMPDAIPVRDRRGHPKMRNAMTRSEREHRVQRQGHRAEPSAGERA